MANWTLSVTQLNNYIKKIFENEEVLIGVSVYGEITNLKRSGVASYFDLKDDNSALPCICFDSSLLAGFDFGSKVTIKGRLNFYGKTGKLSFVVSKIEDMGLGELYKQFLELKAKLQNEGLFDSSKKKPLIVRPKRIGVVTSETGAVINDIVRVAREKSKSVDIVLYPAKVQGIGAEQEIVKGIQFFDDYNVDEIIVARGGGSFEDYAPFNTELVARAVFGSKKPSISAIGHENDWSLIDFVADVRAGTPSIASDMAVFDDRGFFDRAIALNKKHERLLAERTQNLKKQVWLRVNQILANTELALTTNNQNLNKKLDKITGNVNLNFVTNKHRLDVLTTKLEKLNPLALLKSGYAKIEKDGKNVLSVNDLQVGDAINVFLNGGEVKAVVEEKKEKIYGF